MANKAYIVTFDKGGIFDTFNYEAFHQNLISAIGLISWWHYLQSTYILIVPKGANAESINQLLQGIAPNKYFFVARVDLREHNGFLPPQAWEWISQQLKTHLS